MKPRNLLGRGDGSGRTERDEAMGWECGMGRNEGANQDEGMGQYVRTGWDEGRMISF